MSARALAPTTVVERCLGGITELLDDPQTVAMVAEGFCPGCGGPLAPCAGMEWLCCFAGGNETTTCAHHYRMRRKEEPT